MISLGDRGRRPSLLHCIYRKAGAYDGGAPPLVDGADCPLDPFSIIADKSRYINQQSLKLQETPESVPTGEMPRHMQLVVERALADRTAPGTRVSVIGIVSVSAAGDSGRGGSQRSGAVAIRTPYLRVIGIMPQEEGAGRAGTTFTPDEEGMMRRLSRQPGLYERLAASIAPSISGDYTTDIKKAILCLLLAGSRKVC
jgi:DNA replication licensing factor MCM5